MDYSIHILLPDKLSFYKSYILLWFVINLLFNWIKNSGNSLFSP